MDKPRADGIAAYLRLHPDSQPSVHVGYRDARAMAVKRFAADGVAGADIDAVVTDGREWRIHAKWIAANGEERHAILESIGQGYASWKQFADTALRSIASAELLRTGPEEARLAAYAAADAEYEEEKRKAGYASH